MLGLGLGLLSSLCSFLFPIPSCTSAKVERGSGIGDKIDEERQRDTKRRTHDEDVTTVSY